MARRKIIGRSHRQPRPSPRHAHSEIISASHGLTTKITKHTKGLDKAQGRSMLRLLFRTAIVEIRAACEKSRKTHHGVLNLPPSSLCELCVLRGESSDFSDCGLAGWALVSSVVKPILLYR